MSIETPISVITNIGTVKEQVRWGISHQKCAELVAEMALDMADLIQANRQYALEKYGTDLCVESYYCVKKLRARLESLGCKVEDSGGLKEFKNPEGKDYTVAAGNSVYYCSTENEVDAILGLRQFGSLYSVSSPTGKDCSQWIPF